MNVINTFKSLNEITQLPPPKITCLTGETTHILWLFSYSLVELAQQRLTKKGVKLNYKWIFATKLSLNIFTPFKNILQYLYALSHHALYQALFLLAHN